MIISLDENQSIILIRIDDETDKVVVTVNQNFRNDYPSEKINRINQVLAFLYDELHYDIDRQQILEFEPDEELLKKIEKRREEEEKKSNVIHFTRREQ